MIPSLCPKSLSHFYKLMELSIAGRHHCGLKLTARLTARAVYCSQQIDYKGILANRVSYLVGGVPIHSASNQRCNTLLPDV